MVGLDLRGMRPLLAALSVLLVACAETNEPLPEPEEVLLVVNRTSATLSVIPVESPDAAVTVSLGAPANSPTGVAARDSIAVVSLGTLDAVAVVDLRNRTLLRTIGLGPASGASG